MPLGYANPRGRAARPGLLVAVGIVDLVVAALALLSNAYGIVAAVAVYGMTLPVPPPPPPLPVAPVVPLTAYHGDWLPATGLPAADRLAVAVTAPTLTADRRAMLDRILAEAGRGVTPARIGVTQDPAGPDGPGPLGTQHLTTAAGRIDLDNTTATFRPAGNGPPTTVTTNVVGTPARWTAVAIDHAVAAAQQQAHGGLNALQAAALAEHLRRAPPPAELPWRQPVVHVVGPAAPGSGTLVFSADFASQQSWLLPNGAVVVDPSAGGRLDPATGRPFAPPPRPTRRPLPIDSAVIAGSVAEYVASGLLAIVLIVAGVRLLQDRPDAPRLHGGYAAAKATLAIVNLALGVVTAQELAGDGLPGTDWGRLALVLLLQAAYPVALALAFRTTAAQVYFRRERRDGRLIPGPWRDAAAALSPDRWDRRRSAVALAVGLLIVIADGYRAATGGGAGLYRSYTFLPTALVGVVVACCGVAALGRRRATVAVGLAVLCLSTVARAAGPTTVPTTVPVSHPSAGPSTSDLIAAARAIPQPYQRRPLFAQVATRPDGFLPLLAVAADPGVDGDDRSIAAGAVKQWLAVHPRPDTPDARRAVDADVTAMLARVHAGPADSARGVPDRELLPLLADASVLVPTVAPWLSEPSVDARRAAVGLIGSARPDTPQKLDALIAAMGDPTVSVAATFPIAAFTGPGRDDRLARVATADPRPWARRFALDVLCRVDPQRRRGKPVSPATEAIAARNLSDPDQLVRDSAAVMILRNVADPEAKLAAELRGPDPVRRQVAADALAADPKAGPAAAVVLPLLSDPDPATRAAAAAALYSFGGHSPRAPLLSLLDDPDVEVRAQVAADLVRDLGAIAALGEHTSAAFVAAMADLRPRLDRDERRGPRLRPGKPAKSAGVDPAPSYADADPLTGARLGTPAAVRPGPPVLPILAWWTAALAWPALLVLAVGIGGGLAVRPAVG